MAVMMRRALGPAVPLPRRDGVTDAWSVFRLLTDLNAGPGGTPPSVTFLRPLADNVEREPGAMIADQARSLQLGPALGHQRQSRRGPILHLMIMLEPVSTDPKRAHSRILASG